MDHHTGRFVDDHDIVIFEDNVDRNILGINLGIARWVSQDNGYQVTGPNFVAGFYHGTVDQDIPGTGGILNSVAGGVPDFRHHVFIDPQRRLSFVGYEPEVLVQFTGFFADPFRFNHKVRVDC
jgi:hypothetical protein